MKKRTFIHKDCDRAVFGPLYDRYPHNRKVGGDDHDFFSATLEALTGSTDYDRIDLTGENMNGQELYEFVYVKIGHELYMGAIEMSDLQASMAQTYAYSLEPEVE